jgi:general transcriptional corepressor CYC8
MNNDLPMAYTAYQNALNTLSNVCVSSLFQLILFQAHNPDVWYGIGLLYDRYASFDHAEEAFSNVLYIDPNHRKRSEIYFRLGIIYKQQKKYRESIDVNNPSRIPSDISASNIFWIHHRSR